MAMLKAQKIELAKRYLESVKGARNAVVLQHEWITVNDINAIRMDVAEQEGNLEVVKKRVFLKSVEGSYEWLTLDQLPGAIIVLYSYNEADQHAPLKVISKIKKEWKKDKKKKATIDYVWAWYDGEWQWVDYVSEIADLPSKEELVGKFLFLLNHPISSFARVLNAIAEKQGSGDETSEVEETTEE